MGHDEVCLVCGICPTAHPTSFIVEQEQGIETSLSTSLLTAYLPALPPITNSTVFDNLSVLDRNEHFQGPQYIQSWDNRKARGSCIAIRHWDETYGVAFNFEENTGYDSDGDSILSTVWKFRDGQNVEVRHVYDFDGGYFRTTDAPFRTCTVANSDSACFFVTQHCYHYLKTWIDWEGLPVSDHRPPSLSFDGEFYELVNSRMGTRVYREGFLPCIDYDGVEQSLDQWQDYFAPHKSTKHVATAILAGQSGQDLLVPLLKDFGAYVFARPDLWPMPPGNETIPLRTESADIPSTDNTFVKLPVELFILVMEVLPVPSIVALSATCRTLHSLLTTGETIDYITKLRTRSGKDLQWLLPVSRATAEEIDNAHDSANAWLMEYHLVSEPIPQPFEHPGFPWFQFLKACWTYDSTKNRRRIWGIVKQFEGLWRDYRLNGWEVDRFVAPTPAN